MLQGSLRCNSGRCSTTIASHFGRAILLILLPAALSPAVGDPEPDMDGSGCVDLYDVALFQNQFGTIDIPGLAACDFHVDGYCDLLDYEILASVLRGPICDCAIDADCNDSYPCTIDDCYSGVCRNRVTCPNQDDSDADCIREYCTITGCVAGDEVDSSPCGTERHCISGTCCFRSGGGYCNADAECCDAGAVCEDRFCCIPAGSSGCTDDKGACCGVTPCVSGKCCYRSGGGYCNVDAECCDAGAVCEGRFCCIPLGGSGCTDDKGACCGNAQCVAGTCCIQAGGRYCNADADCCGAGAVCNNRFCCIPPGGTGCTTNESACCRSAQCVAETCCFRSGQGVCAADTECCDPGAHCVRGVCTTTGCVGDGDDGSPCDDGVSCTILELCFGGECTGGVSGCGNDNDSDADCIRGDCDPFDGCVQAIEPDGSACEDGIACTGSDYCLAGQCYGGVYYDFLCPNQDYCDDDCIQYYCEPGQGCVQGVEFESAPCWDFHCAFNDQYSACNAAGSCECRTQPPPDWGCPP